MSGVSFLMIVVVISVVGSIIVWLRNRQPSDPLSSVSDFQREMEALGTSPPSVADGGLEQVPPRRVNTVHVRPNPTRPPASTNAAADADTGTDSGTGTGTDSGRER